MITPHTVQRAIALVLVVAGCFLYPTSANALPDLFQPLAVTLQPKVIQPIVPIWETGKVQIQPESDAILVPVPALASQDEIGCFALTVVFDDHGDGGPVVEWQPKEGESILLSAGLGETGIAIGLNARTLLITQSLALDGGTLRITYAGRFSRLISISLRPARELGVAALGAEFTPALLAENESVLTADDVSGAEIKTPSGDRTEGQVFHAELLTAPKQLGSAGFEGGMEFIIPLASKPQASLLQVEIAGLDPESHIDVSLNGESLGPLGSGPFSLNSPTTLLSASGRLQRAGWHPSSLFIPARLWKEGDNSVVLIPNRAGGDEGAPIYLRKAHADLFFAPVSSQSTPPATNGSSTTGVSPDTLSTGSTYGNPTPMLFHTTMPTSLPIGTNSSP